jgi:hypothetical protein
MNLTAQDLAREVASTGFSGESLEKVFRLIGLLDALNSHPFLKPRIALKGGTALNLFHFDVPRLSVDIDLNYIGAADRDTMFAERPKLEQAVQAVCSREGLTVRRMPSEHAGGKWRLTYAASTGGSGSLELDVNFMLRTPLWAPRIAECFAVGSFKGWVDSRARSARARGREARGVARAEREPRHLRRPSTSHRVGSRSGTAPSRVRRLRRDEPEGLANGVARRCDWQLGGRCSRSRADDSRRSCSGAPRGRDLVDKLVAECRERLAIVLPLAANELEFLDRLNGQGDIVPEVLTDDASMQTTLRNHSGLRWKALNMKKRLGVSISDEPT